MEELIYGGKAFSEFQTFYDSSQTFQKGEKEYELFPIPGRSGDLAINKKRFSNVTIPFNCFIRENFPKNYEALMAYLYSQDGYKKLEDSKYPLHYREALFAGVVEPETGVYNQSGMFTISFNCKPQKYLRIGEMPIEVKAGQTIELNNPTRFGASPIIEVTGTGTFTVGNVLFTLSKNTGIVIVDFERQEAYEEGMINRNGDLTMSESDFPTVPSGISTINATGCSLKVYPRWYTL